MNNYKNKGEETKIIKKNNDATSWAVPGFVASGMRNELFQIIF